MSSDLYSTLLHWTAHAPQRACAKLQGRRLKLECAHLALAGVLIDGIEYTPEVGSKRILPKFEGWRDMTGEEIKAADELLERLALEALA